MPSLLLCQNLRRMVSGSCSVTMWWPVPAPPPVIALVAVAMAGSIGLTMQGSRWMNYIEVRKFNLGIYIMA